MNLNIEKAAKNFKKWSLYRLAIELGLPNQAVYSWNSGKKVPRLDTNDKICKVLGCTFNDLLEV